MFIILVEFDNRQGKYPLILKGDQYMVGEKPYGRDSLGVIMTGKLAGKEAAKLLDLSDLAVVSIQAV